MHKKLVSIAETLKTSDDSKEPLAVECPVFVLCFCGMSLCTLESSLYVYLMLLLQDFPGMSFW